MKLLMLGDVVGMGGCKAVETVLPSLKKRYNADFVIINGENSAQGNGILPSSARQLFDYGADVITTGNHVFRRREIYDFLEENPNIIRPANYSVECPGNGYYIADMLKYKVAVINMMGTSGMEPLDNPFFKIDRMLEEIKADIIIVDFHAETTSEKKSFGFYLDGRVSLVAGTHTHVQTADAQIFKEGTGYITDLGMCGPYWSVLGVKPEQVIARFRNAMPTRFENAEGEQQVCGIFAEICEKSGKTLDIQPLSMLINC